MSNTEVEQTMTMKIIIFLAATSFMLLIAFAAAARFEDSCVFNLERYIALKPGLDVTQVLAYAWKEACASVRPSTLIIPKGTYKLREADFKGPCKSSVEIQFLGTLQASINPNNDSWVTFTNIDRLKLTGGGVFDGQGKTGWEKKDCQKNKKCDKRPISLMFNFITNSMVDKISSLNSKNSHMKVLGCRNFTFQDVNIIAPEDSPNTNGIHIVRSDTIVITKSHIATGDDCISLGDGSKRIDVSDVTCGPGHGISVGSLGKYSMEEPVEGVIVKNCTMNNTMNGVIIKTWPASPSTGTASNMIFEDIVMVNVSNPILIDQEYCPWNLCNRQIPSKIKISKVSFTNIRGTSATPVAVKLVCSKTIPCAEVKVADINLTYYGREGPSTSQCLNVKPFISGRQNPRICSSPYVFS